ncbi:MAG: hypothetical protein WCH05_05655 [Chlorobiaceae bacterium]
MDFELWILNFGLVNIKIRNHLLIDKYNEKSGEPEALRASAADGQVQSSLKDNNKKRLTIENLLQGIFGLFENKSDFWLYRVVRPTPDNQSGRFEKRWKQGSVRKHLLVFFMFCKQQTIHPITNTEYPTYEKNEIRVHCYTLHGTGDVLEQ